ncbi:hypothetical protein AAE478_010117 [Parahypoxylon ruwenzoriense]
MPLNELRDLQDSITEIEQELGSDDVFDFEAFFKLLDTPGFAFKAVYDLQEININAWSYLILGKPAVALRTATQDKITWGLIRIFMAANEVLTPKKRVMVRLGEDVFWEALLAQTINELPSKDPACDQTKVPLKALKELVNFFVDAHKAYPADDCTYGLTVTHLKVKIGEWSSKWKSFWRFAEMVIEARDPGPRIYRSRPHYARFR